MKSEPNYIVGIGSSAGGLIEITRLFSTLSCNTGMAFVVVSHLSPTEKFQLSEILARFAAMPVIDAVQGMEVRANHVYVVAKDSKLFLDGNSFVIRSPRTIATGRHTQFNSFLISLARTAGERSIAIIMSVKDCEGAEGCRSIKEQGGHVFFQDNSASADRLRKDPGKSSDTGHLLKPEDIAKRLEDIASKGFVTQMVT